jgi:ADP-ribosylation factor GTPase-activating protein 2/3
MEALFIFHPKVDIFPLSFQYEHQHKLAQFDGRSSISSDDYYGDGKRSSKTDYYNTGPDLQDIKDGVRQGVTKVAGKLSNFANGVMTSLQVGS